jgi:Mg2+-importing ATPase
MQRVDSSKSADDFWSIPAEDVLRRLSTSVNGLAEDEAQRRLEQFGPNVLRAARRHTALGVFFSQFKSPITLILIACAALSGFLSDVTDAVIILTIVVASALLGFWQEWLAGDALSRLLALVAARSDVIRDGARRQIPSGEIVPGDVVLLAAGSTVPADCRLIEARDLFVDQATLTGESYPVEKSPHVVDPGAALADRANVVYQGTHVVSGTARAVAVHTGWATEFGRISGRLELRPPHTEFEAGVRRFGYFLMEVTLLLVLAIFAANVLLARPVLESFVFALALAVGLTPQLLPAIISVNLAHGARQMSRKRVIVRRLEAIENFGSMTVLCSDKTGTLTEGKVRVSAAIDARGAESSEVLRQAFLNSYFETGYANPIDEAIRETQAVDTSAYRKLDEIPYDFLRKRLSILVEGQDGRMLITKGAVANVLEVCTQARLADGALAPIDLERGQIEARFRCLSEQGFRVLAVACRRLDKAATITRDDERGLILIGFLALEDRPKAGIEATIERLREQGVALRIITGDNRLVAAHVAQAVGLPEANILTGTDLRRRSDEALVNVVTRYGIFAEIEPNQKERIVLALKKAGEVVGYLGDGINDATALHAADVGISVDQAVDVAREAADIVLLEHDLGVLSEGVEAGRATFANTLKYVFMATSANFGNMFSMAGASLLLPFLPLLPKQILLTNLLTDIPEMTIAQDRVDEEWIRRPRRWNVGLIRRFMLAFGTLSSVFDFATFAVLLWAMRADASHFRTAWFVESVISASLVVLIIRTRRPFWQSRPNWLLALATLVVAVIAVALGYSPLAAWLGFVRLPANYLLAIGLIVLAYVATAEWLKHVFYRRH